MASTLSSAQLYDPLSPQSASLLSQFAQIHSACILNDHTIATFLPPLSLPTMVTWWEARAADAESGSRKIIYVLSSSSSGEQDPSGNGHGKQEVAGVVMLCLPSAVATGPHRAMVEKLLVSPDHRRKGVAKVLMGKLEEVALELGRTNLLLDTETGSPAESIYPRLGYTEIGKVPGYVISPRDGKLGSETFFYKNL